MNAYPVEVETLFYEASRLMAEGQEAPAEERFRTALAQMPDFYEANANLGLLLNRQRRWAEAEYHYREALALCPEQPQTYLNLGGMLAECKRFDEAEALYRQALENDPVAVTLWSNLGVLLACRQQEAEAETCYRTALALQEDYATAAFNLAYLLLRQGRMEEGWSRLEARDWYAPLERYLQFPRWRGEALAGKSLLIGVEAGHGDMMQFARYAALIKAQGASRVGVLCHPGLARLFTTLVGADDIFPLDRPVPAEGWDYWSPPLSLPFYFETRLDSVPADLPYLSPDPELVAQWAPVLANDDPQALKVGLVWKGSVGFENDADRSLPSLELLAPLGAIPGIRFISLQKGAGETEAQQPPAGLPLLHLGGQVTDFADTAAIVSQLDLVIAVDTGVAHLTGALGKPCWVLLPWYKADWRWLKDRSDSHWYPQVMRLFRQPAMGDWESVIADVTEALRTWVADRG